MKADIKNILDSQIRHLLTEAFPIVSNESSKVSVITNMSNVVLNKFMTEYSNVFDNRHNAYYEVINTLATAEDDTKCFDILYGIYNEDLHIHDLVFYLISNSLSSTSIDDIYNVAAFLMSDDFFSTKYNIIKGKLISDDIFVENRLVDTINGQDITFDEDDNEVLIKTDRIIDDMSNVASSVQLRKELKSFPNPITYFNELTTVDPLLKKYNLLDSEIELLNGSLQTFLIDPVIDDFLQYKYPNDYFRNIREAEEQYEMYVSSVNFSTRDILSPTIKNMIQELSTVNPFSFSEKTKKSSSLLFKTDRPGIFYNQHMNNIHIAAKNRSYEYFTEKDIESALENCIFHIIEIIDSYNSNINKNIAQLKNELSKKQNELKNIEINTNVYENISDITLSSIEKEDSNNYGINRLKVITDSISTLENKLRNLEFAKFSYIFPSDNIFFIPACQNIFKVMLNENINNIEELNMCKMLLLVNKIYPFMTNTEKETFRNKIINFMDDISAYVAFVNKIETVVLADKRFKRGV